MKMPIFDKGSAKRARRFQDACLEAMEPRLLLSAAKPMAKKVAPVTASSGVQLPIAIIPKSTSTPVKTKKLTKKAITATASPDATGTASPNQVISPAQMRAAYLGTNFNFDGVTGDGTGETIAIIDAYDDPNLVSSSASNFATSDLAGFDAYFHLPNPPSFIKYGVSGNTVTNTPPGVSTSADWPLEESLDVEWAHVMAPEAKIVLLEASSNSNSNLFGAVQAANALGVNVVSMSFGFDEPHLGSFNDNTYNGYFDSNSTITYVASAGDQGAFGSSATDNSTSVMPQYPAASPYVVAVGGTSLSASTTAWTGETTWGNSNSSQGSGGGGGGSSVYSSKPTYQIGFGSGTARQYPDIALDGNPNTGVAVYDSYDYGSATPWVNGYVGGTSLAAPLMAGLVAVADQGRALRNLVPLNSNGLNGGVDIHTLLYSIGGNSTSYAADFHDITTGNDTGPGVQTGNSGAPPNFSPQTGYDLTTGLGTPVAYNLTTDLAYYNTSVGATSLAINQSAITNLYFKQDANSLYTDVWVNSATPGTGSYTYKFLDAEISSLTYAGTSGNDTFTLDLSAGTALETAGFTVNVIGNSSGTNTLKIVGTSTGNTSYNASSSSISFGNTTVNYSYINNLYLSPPTGTNTLLINGNTTGNDAFTVTSSAVVFNSLTFNESNISLVTLNPGTGTDSLAVNSGSVTIAVQTPGAGILTRNFSSISIATGSSGIFATAPLHTDRMLVETSTLAVAGQLDLGGNDLIIHNGNLATINTLLASGYNNGLWTGTGIDSAAAHSDTTHLTALGAIQNTLYGGSGQPTFDGASPLTTDVLIKYTYYGDADLSGKVDGTDYSRIDNAYGTALTGWYNGDFNYDSKVNGSDYTLIDNAYNTQGNML